MTDDYAKLIEEVRGTIWYNRRPDLINDLADAVEALQDRVGCDHMDAPYRRVLAERDALRESFQEAEQIHEGVVRRLSAERDALRAEVEKWRSDFHEWETVGAPLAAEQKHELERRAYTAEREHDALRAQLASMTWEGTEYHALPYHRLVGPWTPVEGEQA